MILLLPINTIARVIVNTVRTAASPASFDTGLLLVKDGNYSDDRRLLSCSSAAEAAAGMVSLGFTEESEPYKAAVKYFAASPAPGRLLVSCYPASESLCQALSSVLDLTVSFYGVLTADPVSAADWLETAQYTEGLDQPLMLFVPVTGTVADVTAPGGTLEQLRFTGIRRALPFYCAAPSDCAAVMGTAMGLELAHRDTAFALCYKMVQGIRPSAIAQSEVDLLKALNCNVYVARDYTHLLLENGMVSNGQRYDEILYTDRIAEDLQNAAVNLLAENPDRLSQTDDSTAQFINRFSSVLTGYTDRGVLASAVWRGTDIGPVKHGEIVENGFLLWADSYDNQSDADRQAHKAVPVQCALTLAGSIESIVISVNVQI